METRTETLDQQIVTRYTGQPSRLPADLRRRIESAWDGPVMLYAFADLDPALQLAETWVALGATQVAVARQAARTGAWEIDLFSAGASARCGRARGFRPRRSPLRRRRMSRRSRCCATTGNGALRDLRFVLEEGLAERTVAVTDADREYAEAVAHPVRDAQALVGGRPKAVIWRLLAYLRPYRRELTLGMAAATLIPW